MSNQNLIFTFEPFEQLARLINNRDAVVFTDSNCLPLIRDFISEHDLKYIVMEAGEENKTLATTSMVWTKMQEFGCTRKSLLINFGGGVVTDLGGFAAATFKRGIDFINLPTTILAAVDASVGGKTGINLEGVKNEIGVFRDAEYVIISTVFFSSLSYEQLLSGYAEMIKHGLLISEEEFRCLMSFDIAYADFMEFLPILQRSVMIKARIVNHDPTEKGIRRYLNLGHTAGHAFESLSLRRGIPLPHGYAVAVGMVTSLVVSYLKLGFPSGDLQLLADFVKTNYGNLSQLPINCEDYDELLELMSHDKKNPSRDSISFTLLDSPGKPVAGMIIPPETLRTALDITRDLLGL